MLNWVQTSGGWINLDHYAEIRDEGGVLFLVTPASRLASGPRLEGADRAAVLNRLTGAPPADRLLARKRVAGDDALNPEG